MSRRTVYPLAAGLLLVFWLSYTLLLAFGALMISADEEWGGWGDVLLNPYLMGPWVALGITFGTLALLHLRSRRH